MESLPQSLSHEHEAHGGETTRSPLSRKEYLIGIGLLMIVVILWTSSNFITQDLYEAGYDKPFLVTYMNTSAFSFYLAPLLFRRWWSRREGITRKSFSSDRRIDEYQPLSIEEPTEYGFSSESHIQHTLPPLTDKQTANLAFTFCLMWFAANWSVNASLGYTSVASATVLSSMSGFFTLGIGRLFRVEKLTIIKFSAVATSFLGVLIVSMSDSNVAKPTGQNLNSDNVAVFSNAILGDTLALVSALFYAMYVILLKVRIKSESRIDMQLFFGFVGLFNIVVCFPLGLILHLTGAETFELPPTRNVWSAILINMAITLSSDYLYVIAMLKTTPLVVTVGLSLTIPFAVLGDFIRLRPTQAGVIIGALLVLCSFIAIGLEDANEQEEAIVVSGPDEEH